MRLNLGFMEAGSQINIDTFSVTINVPSNPSTGNKPIRATYTKPMRVRILCNGTVVKTFEGTIGFGESADSGQTLQMSATGGAFYIAQKNVGNYSVEFDLNSCIQFRCEGIATVSIASASYYVGGSFARANYERTILGNDGLLSMWSNGAMLMNKNAFIAIVGSYGIRVDSSGIKKTTNAGLSWGTANI